MKKIALALALIALVSSAVIADDATVLPKGIFRARLIPSYTTLDKAFDAEGESVDASITAKVVTLSGAFEVGLADPFTLGLKWAPGYNVSGELSDIPLMADSEKAENTGPADLEIGAKIQVLGSQGFVKSDSARLALTVGGSIPLDSYDAQDEWEAYRAGDAFRPQSASGHQSFGGGVKADGDFKLTQNFYFNIHGEAKFYMPNESLQFGTIGTYWGTYATVYAAQVGALGDAGAAAAAVAYADANAPMTDTKTEYGIETMFEFEPHISFDLSETTNLSIGLPVSYAYRLADTTTYNGTETEGDPSSILYVKPCLSLFTMLGPLPAEFQIEYDYPLLGESESAASSIVLQLKIFGKIF